MGSSNKGRQWGRESEEVEEEESGDASTSTLCSDKSGKLQPFFSNTKRDETQMLRGGGPFQLNRSAFLK